MAEPTIPPKVVKPRKAGAKWLPIVTYHDGLIFVERTGEVYPSTQLESLVASESPFILVAQNVAGVIARLDKVFNDNPRWQFRVTPVRTEIWSPNREARKVTIQDTVVSFFGFRRAHGGSTDSKYHLTLDPFLFIRANRSRRVTDKTGVTVPSNVTELYRWADEIRGWCITHDVPLKPTNGGLAAQLLRDSRFYPVPRRKVPRATNDRSREVLPGNYYKLLCDEQKRYTATYFDQSAAHHSCARDVSLPDADTLYAKGYFNVQPGSKFEGKLWARAGSELFRKVIQEPGLFLLEIENRRGNRFPLPCQEFVGRKQAFVYSNELDYLRESGTLIHGIIAAWTSNTYDAGIRQYANWALQQIQTYPELKDWLKPTLLATYGVLAAKPTQLEFGFKRAKGGVEKVYPVGGELLTVLARVAARETETPVANVIHRGMIEAETRLRSVTMARWLHDQGFRVLAIYADSVFIENGTGNVPFPPEGWRIQEHLTNLVFYNEVSFTSDQLTKLPGIPKDDADRLSIIRQAGALFRDEAARKRSRSRAA